MATESSSKPAFRQFSTKMNSVRCKRLRWPRRNLKDNCVIYSIFSSVICKNGLSLWKRSYATCLTCSTMYSSILKRMARNSSKHLLKSVFCCFFDFNSFSLYISSAYSAMLLSFLRLSMSDCFASLSHKSSYAGFFGKSLSSASNSTLKSFKSAGSISTSSNYRKGEESFLRYFRGRCQQPEWWLSHSLISE